MKKFFTLFVLCFLNVLSYAAVPPTVTSSGLQVTEVDGSRLSMRFTTGNGLYRIVVVKEGGAVTGLPVNGREYTANSNFGTAGTEFTGPGEYVVAKSSWNSFTVQNLKPGTTYHIAVFEYNGTGSTAEYLMLPLTGSQPTAVAPTTQAAFTTSSTTGNTITLNFSKGNGNGRLILARKTGPVNAIPADLSNYYVDEIFGNGAKLNVDNYVVYKGIGTSVTVKNLEPNTAYHFAIFEYNGNSSPVFLSPGGTNTVTTNAGPTVAASSIGLNYVEGNSFRLGCTVGNGSRRLFIMSKNGPITAEPINGTVYTGNTVFGTAGTEIAPGEFIVGATTGSSVSVTNLEGNTLYYFRIYEYDIDNANNTYYLTSSSAIKTGSTALIPTVIGTNLTLTNITGSSASIGLTHGNGTMRMVIVKQGSAVDAVPADYIAYSGNANYGQGTQITPGNYVTHGGINGNPFTINNLSPGVTYHVAIYEFNGNSAPVYSRTAATFSFTVPLQPTSCSTSPWSTFYEGSSFRFIWTSGNGGKRIVVARKGAPVSTTPTDGILYTASANFGEGDALSGDEFVVYDGTYYSVDVKKMDIGSTYHFAVFEYNLGADGNPDYLTSCWLAGSASTVGWPTVQATIQSATNIQVTQANINFTKGNGTSRLFIMREGTPVSATPQDLVKYGYNSSFGTAGSHISDGNYVVLLSNGTGYFTVTNLKPQATYHVSVFEYNGSAEPAYLRDFPSTLSFTTTDVPGATVPTTASVNPIFSGPDGNKFNFKWTSGNGEKRIAVMKKGSAVNFIPSSATNYPANAAFGSGADLGDGEYVVFNGTGNSVDITNLQPSSVYYLTVFEYNGTGSLIRYLTTSTLTADGYTISAPTTVSHDVVPTVTANSITLNWENGNGTGRIVVMKEGNAVGSSPVNLSVYPASAVFKSGSQIAAGEYVVYAGNGTSVTVTGLSENIYHFSLFEYNGNAAPVYNTTNVTSGDAVVGSPLPVTLTYFTAEEKGESVLLKWSTAQETGNAYFDVERSTDGNIFQMIKRIQGAGNSNTPLAYSYTDQLNPGTEKIHYRLKQVDIDGKYSYSKIVTVQPGRLLKNINIYPNPVQQQLTIQLPGGIHGAMLEVYNAGGARIFSQKIASPQQINTAGWSNGVYFLRIQYGSEKYQTRIIKN